jgi:PAS domain S-box-containing protein
MLAATVDITELRETEAALKESQNRFRAFMDFAPLAAHLRDAEGRYLMFNRRMEELIGVPAEEALGRMPGEIRSPDVVGNSDRHHRLVVETGRLHASEQYLLYHPDDPRWTMAIRFPVFDAGGRVEAVGTFAVDITERKQAEAALQASEARLNAINAASPTTPATKKNNGGGRRSHSRRMPDCAAFHVIAIHATVATPVITAARIVAASSALLRRHENPIAHTNSAASTAGMTMNAVTAGEV